MRNIIDIIRRECSPSPAKDKNLDPKSTGLSSGLACLPDLSTPAHNGGSSQSTTVDNTKFSPRANVGVETGKPTLAILPEATSVRGRKGGGVREEAGDPLAALMGALAERGGEGGLLGSFVGNEDRERLEKAFKGGRSCIFVPFDVSISVKWGIRR